ncbi:MAG: hypothetical protein AB1775_02570 [Bacteroidota bacterium]
MKSFIKIFVSLFVLIFLFSCLGTETENSNYEFAVGTVVHGGVEGPAFGIRTDDGKNFDPINLPIEFQVYGKRISFKYIVRNDLTSTHMWGTIVEIIEVKEIPIR